MKMCLLINRIHISKSREVPEEEINFHSEEKVIKHFLPKRNR